MAKNKVVVMTLGKMRRVACASLIANVNFPASLTYVEKFTTVLRYDHVKELIAENSVDDVFDLCFTALIISATSGSTAVRISLFGDYNAELAMARMKLALEIAKPDFILLARILNTPYDIFTKLLRAVNKLDPQRLVDIHNAGVKYRLLIKSRRK